MTETAKNFAAKAIELAGERTETTRKTLRRNGLAYLGLHGMAFDQAKAGAEKLRTERKALFNGLVAKGEDMEAGAAKLFKGTQEKIEDAAEGFAEGTRKRVWNMMPGATVNRVEALEAEIEEAKTKLKTISKKTQTKAKAAPAKAKKAAAKVSKPVKAAVAAAKPVVKAPVKVDVKTASAPKAEVKTAPVAKASLVAAPKETPAPKPAAAQKAPTAKTASAKPVQARHIPYFNDVKRYDPFANEDIVRKIVNHCGIALSSEDARYVACTDETERNRVRDSWLKKKLEAKGTDVELDKKVQNVCSIMQRDNRKNRVTFYYLAAKAERKLEAI